MSTNGDLILHDLLLQAFVRDHVIVYHVAKLAALMAKLAAMGQITFPFSVFAPT